MHKNIYAQMSNIKSMKQKMGKHRLNSSNTRDDDYYYYYYYIIIMGKVPGQHSVPNNGHLLKWLI